MICFPNAKINIGLNILRKRTDGYHDISSCFYPINLCDALEIVPASENSFQVRGQNLSPDQDNLVTKALRLVSQDYSIPPLSIYLLKTIPIGAGLGGGSADAAFMIGMLSELFNLNLSTETKEAYARKLGSDCAFFIRNRPTYCYGKGDEFLPIELPLIGYHLLLVNPRIHISTAEAYAHVKPSVPDQNLQELLQLPIEDWKNHIHNDFEYALFERYPEIAQLKNDLYELGAIYASMTGSGSSVYGIFKNAPNFDNKFKNCFVWQGELS